jgi:DNA-directed RNA polymerase subunit E'/Rpb7
MDENKKQSRHIHKDRDRGKGNGEKQVFGVYIKSVLTQKVVLSITEIGGNIKQVLEEKLVHQNEGKCIPQGFIKPKSINIIRYSCGLINSPYTEFYAVFECMICHPIEKMIIDNCTVKTITKAGIHAEVITENDVVPIVVFIAKDHHNTNKYFNSIKENEKITVKVIGVRFELNDSYISVIAELTEPSFEKEKNDRKYARGGAGNEKWTINDSSEDLF